MSSQNGSASVAQSVASVGLCHSVSIVAKGSKKAFLHMMMGRKEHSWMQRATDWIGEGLRVGRKSCHIYFYSSDRGTGVESLGVVPDEDPLALGLAEYCRLWGQRANHVARAVLRQDMVTLIAGIRGILLSTAPATMSKRAGTHDDESRCPERSGWRERERQSSSSSSQCRQNAH